MSKCGQDGCCQHESQLDFWKVEALCCSLNQLGLAGLTGRSDSGDAALLASFSWFHLVNSERAKLIKGVSRSV